VDSELIIADAIGSAKNRIESHNRIAVSISGGSDSDDVLDIIKKCKTEKDIFFINFNTGLEYQATKDHLKYLEKRYKITIVTIRPEKPVPLCVKKFGEPFLNKRASEMIMRLQKHNFKFEDKPFEELYKEYPNCKSALRWWCNYYDSHTLNIANNKYLKEFLIENPPQFQISNLCCHFAKKVVAADFNKKNNIDLNINGIRKAEGGIRSVSYKSCFTPATKDKGYDTYRTIFWFTDDIKRQYEKENNIIHSKCYTEYGLKRTGCCGCPFGKDFEFELKVLKKYEPKLYKAAVNIFKNSYDYTREYREYVKLKKNNGNIQISFLNQEGVYVQEM
jgi:3'-phosphoadenosine 5'-phosphosulfate sulfotransferase (PAPS reductase)/FAD synthetase